ncbi:MAG: glycosyltransferase family 4 protein [Candidatus Helarchaeota archaeon]
MQFPPIIMLTYNFFPEIGGIEIAVLNFARVLANHKHEVHVIVPSKPNFPKEEVIQTIPVHRFPFDWDMALAALLQNEGVDSFRSQTIERIQQITRQIGNSYILHTHGEAIIAGGWLKEINNNIKLVFTPHASPQGLKELLNTKIFGPYHFIPALKKTDLIAYHAMNLLPQLQLLGIDSQKIREIVNIIDPMLFNPLNFDKKKMRLALGLPVHSKILFSPTRVDDEKGLIELVSALPEILEAYSDIHLYLAGDLTAGFILDPRDVQRKIIRKIRRHYPELTKRVHFTGAIPYHQMPQWYSAADVIVLISRDECLPMCLLEAMAMEKPIVATNVGGIPLLLDKTTSELIQLPPIRKVPPAIVAEAVKNVLARSEGNKIDVKKLRQKILNQYSPEVGYQKLRAIYSEVISI